MQLSECDKIVGELFPGKYRAVQFELTTHHNGTVVTNCGVYIEDRTWYWGRTFSEVIDLMNGKTKTEEPQEIAA
jgi:hypothetical protein